MIIVQALALDANCREIDQAADAAALAIARGKTVPLGFVETGTIVRPIAMADLADLSKEVLARNIALDPPRAIADGLRAINAGREVSLADRCAIAHVVAGTRAGTVLVEATIGDYTRATTETYRAAVPTRVRASADGSLGEDDSTITVGVDLTVARQGQVSSGTEVAFSAEVTPPGAIGHFCASAQRLSTA